MQTNNIHSMLMLGFACAMAASTASAEDAAADAPYAITGNVAVVSDYIFRGLTQSWGGPAIQGGGDLTMKSGFAAGFWSSSMSNHTFPGAAMELDLYANYGRPINDDWSWRLGLYGYFYPRGNLDHAGLPSRSFNTVEAQASLTWKWLTLKYSDALTDFFAIDKEQGYRGDSKGTDYIELDAAIPFNDQWSLALQAGHQNVSTRLAVPLPSGSDNPDYNDVGATLKYQFSPHWNASLGATYADNHKFYGHTASFTNPNDTRDVAGTRGFVMLQGTF